MDAQLRKILIALEEQAITSHTTEELLVLTRQLEEVSALVEEGIAKSLISPDTIALAHNVTSHIANVFEMLIGLEEDMSHLRKELDEDMQAILSPSQPRSSRVHQDNATRFLSLPAAIDWFLVNMHNPYPSKNIRTAFSRSAGCTRQQVDKWFSDVRKESGWNRLWKTHFSNKKSALIEAATQYFVAKDRTRPLDIKIEVEFAKFAVTTRALLGRHEEVACSSELRSPFSSNQSSSSTGNDFPPDSFSRYLPSKSV